MVDDELLKQIIELLSQIVDDKTVPKNIRENAQKAINDLSNKSLEISVRVDRAIQLLDDVSEDPNMPVYTRTQIWNLVSLLESLLQEQ